MLVAKYTFFDVLSYCIKQKLPGEEGKPATLKWVERVEAGIRPAAEAKALAEAKVAELKAANDGTDYVVELESGRMVERIISGVKEAYQVLPPKQVRATPDGVDPPTPPFVGVVLAFMPLPDDPEANPQQPLSARDTAEEHKHPRHVEILNESGKQIARYEL
jgi:hypothetical protein